jgi:hypothetical protein
MLLPAACSRPVTDIVATNTEGVGQYTVVARAANDTLHAQVCLEPSADAEGIAERVVHQVMNHGYHTITLDLFSPRDAATADVTHVVWTAAAGHRVTGREADQKNPCDMADVRGRSS